VQGWIDGRRFDVLRLLFVGRDWHRKGGDLVLAACECLRLGAVPLRLDIVGIERLPVDLPPYARLHGVLNKRNPEAWRQLEGLLAQAHFLFVPSRAENYGMVFCEAAAYGVPSIATNTGGIPTIVRNGCTGFTLPQDRPPRDFAEAIESCFSDPRRYRDLARSSLAEYHERLNWHAFGRRLFEVIAQIAG
jgi:glycosyltransferase involved in cell wall biosynthesis